MRTTPLGSPKQSSAPRTPQTPESPNEQQEHVQRKKTSPISALTKNSWNSFRSKFGKGPDPSSLPDYTPEFFVISTDSPKKSKRTQQIFGIPTSIQGPENDAFVADTIKTSVTPKLPHLAFLGPPLEIPALTETSLTETSFTETDTQSLSDELTEGLTKCETEHDYDEDTGYNEDTNFNEDRFKGTNFLGIPGTQVIDPLEFRSANVDRPEYHSDSASQYSFSRVSSMKYYKPEGSPTPQSAASTVGSSFLSRSSVLTGDSDFYAESNWDAEEDFEDLSHLEDVDLYSNLIAEANQQPLEHWDESPEIGRTKSTGSMHRQLSKKVTRDDSVITFFNEATPKRAKSQMSTSSSVFPIME